MVKVASDCGVSPVPQSEATRQFSKCKVPLVEHCFSCHSAQAGKLKGGLALDTRDALRKGGDSGALLDLKNPGESLLLKVLKYDGDIHMPPKGSCRTR